MSRMRRLIPVLITGYLMLFIYGCATVVWAVMQGRTCLIEHHGGKP